MTAETAELTKRLGDLKDERDLLMQKLMSDERKWETIMMMQVRCVEKLQEAIKNNQRPALHALTLEFQVLKNLTHRKKKLDALVQSIGEIKATP